jgi:MarR family transcriptional regulator, organic hydroperoxide resistance regulator
MGEPKRIDVAPSAIGDLDVAPAVPEDVAAGSVVVGVPAPAAAEVAPISHAVFRVARLHRMLAGPLLRRVGLHLGQEMVMMQLWDRGPQRLSDLARVLDADAPTITRTIQRLERDGFVRRTPCATDKRVTIVEATPASRSLREQVENLWTEVGRITAEGVSADEQAAALRVLERIEANLARAIEQNT